MQPLTAPRAQQCQCDNGAAAVGRDELHGLDTCGRAAQTSVAPGVLGGPRARLCFCRGEEGPSQAEVSVFFQSMVV